MCTPDTLTKHMRDTCISKTTASRCVESQANSRKHHLLSEHSSASQMQPAWSGLEQCINSCSAELLNRAGQRSVTHVITNLRLICLLIFLLLADVIGMGLSSWSTAWLLAPQTPGGIDAGARGLLSPSWYTSMAGRMQHILWHLKLPAALHIL